MKKLIQMLSIAAVTVLAVGCSDNDKVKESEPKTTYTAEELAGAYTAQNVLMKVDHVQQSGVPVTVSGSNLSKMVFELGGPIDGANLTFSNVAVSNANNFCTFSDDVTYASGAKTYVLGGNIVNGKLNIHISSAVTPDISKVYKYNEVIVELSGSHFDLLPGQTIEVSGADLATKTIKLPASTVPGEGELSIQITNDGSGHFKGSVSNADRDINADVCIADDKLHVVLTPNYKNDMVGVWNLPAPVMDDNDNDLTAASTLVFNAATTDGKASYFGMEVDVDYFNASYSQFLSSLLRPYDVNDGTYVGCLRNITFHADGNMTAEYNANYNPLESNAPQWIESPIGAMRWYVKAGQLYLVPNLNLMTKAGISSDGLPLSFREVTTDYGKTYRQVYLTKDFVVPAFSLINMVVASLPDDMHEFMPMIKILIGDFGVTAAKATHFDLNLNLEKAQ